MATSAAVAMKRKIDLSEILNDGVITKAKTQVQEKTQDKKFENIAANAFYKIVFDENTTLEEKKNAVIKALTYQGTKEQMRTTLQEYFALEEYLQSVREEMATDIIRITDTQTFSELKLLFDQMNSDFLTFDEKMQPLTDILDALYILRTDGKTLDIFKEIKDDAKQQEEINSKRNEIASQLTNLQNSMKNLMVQNSTLENTKSFFGFGGITSEAKEKIAYNKMTLDENEKNLDSLQKNLESLQVQSSDAGEYANEKEKLKELLDITTDQHKQRQDELVNAALNFVKTAKERIGSVRDHLGQMDKQIENLADANGNMLGVYAILDEGIKGAETENKKISDDLTKPSDNEDAITKLTREQKKSAVDQHIAAMDQAAVSTTSTFADLTSQSIRINTMKTANINNINKARTLHSQGVAGVADRLSVVLQAVSSAALGESSAMAKQTLEAMASSTNKIAQKEAIKNAMGISDTNDELAKAIEDVGAYGEVIKAATDVSREGLKEMRAKLAELSNIAQETRANLNDNISINADVQNEKVSIQKDESPQQDTSFKSPFGGLGVKV